MSPLELVPEQAATVRCAVIASDPLVQSALERTLAGAWGIALEDDLLDADVALVDGANDPEEALAEAPDHPAVLLLVGEGAAAGPLLARGALGVVRRDAEAETLSAALHAIHAGLTVIDPAFRPAEAIPRIVAEPLTRREREVLQLIADGLSNRKIAKKLGISEHTAKFHVNAILTKLDADTRTEAVVRAARLGWLLL
jgi:DNA-binding NarL/FixJ family response regulator